MQRRPPAMLVFLTAATAVSGVSLIASSLPDITVAFAVSDAAAGWVLGAASMPGIVLALVVGLSADRWGRVRMVVPGLLLFGAAGIASPFASTFGLFLVLRGLQGVGAAALVNLTAVIIADHWQGAERSRMIGRNSAAVTTSIAILPIVGGALTDWIGWQGPFYLYGLAIPLAVAVRRHIPETVLPPSGPAGEQLRAAGRFLTRPSSIGFFTIGVVVFILTFGFILTVAPFHAERVFGLSATARGVLLALPSAMSTVVALFLGRLIARVGHLRLMATGALVYAVALAALGLAPGVVWFGAGLLLAGVADALSIPTLQDVMLAGSEPEARGLAASLNGSAARTGQTVGPMISSPLLAGAGSTSTFYVGAGLSLALGVSLVVSRRRRDA